jgi:hypothetical protein
MTYYHKWSIGDLENLMPFELDLYQEMISSAIQKEKEKEFI